jgi:hypothetical protein
MRVTTTCTGESLLNRALRLRTHSIATTGTTLSTVPVQFTRRVKWSSALFSPTSIGLRRCAAHARTQHAQIRSSFGPPLRKEGTTRYHTVCERGRPGNRRTPPPPPPTPPPLGSPPFRPSLRFHRLLLLLLLSGSSRYQNKNKGRRRKMSNPHQTTASQRRGKERPGGGPPPAGGGVGRMRKGRRQSQAPPLAWAIPRVRRERTRSCFCL